MIAVQRPVLFVISMIVGLVFMGFVLDRVVFLIGAVHTMGTVINMSWQDGQCGRKGSRYDCTRYRAEVEFESLQTPTTLWVDAGSAHGLDQPVAAADYAMGDMIPVLFNPRHPTQSYRNAALDIWRVPLLILFLQMILLIGSFSRRYSWFSS